MKAMSKIQSILKDCARSVCRARSVLRNKRFSALIPSFILYPLSFSSFGERMHSGRENGRTDRGNEAVDRDFYSNT